MSRENTKTIKVGSVQIGGGTPVSVQSMCNTKTEDVSATLSQLAALEAAGCDIARLAVPHEAAAAALPSIREGCRMPLVADIHFDYKLAIAAVEAGFDKIRINPGNIGSRDKVRMIADACRANGTSIRVGVNGGSLEKHLLEKYGNSPQALCESAMGHVHMLEDMGFDDICISVKSSDVNSTVEAYRLIAKQTLHPLHLGVTESGTAYAGLVKSSVGIGSLLLDGIGSTIRVSLTADPLEEVKAGIAILKAVGLRREGVEIISCPSCGRTEVDLFSLTRRVEELLSDIKTPVTVAVMGCVVNGPGEARHADFGIAGGKGEGLIFKNGEIVGKVAEENLPEALSDMVHKALK